MKGQANGNCNVTACQKPGAIYYNSVMHAYYCESCAVEIERYAGDMVLFPNLKEKRLKARQCWQDGIEPTAELIEC